MKDDQWVIMDADMIVGLDQATFNFGTANGAADWDISGLLDGTSNRITFIGDDGGGDLGDCNMDGVVDGADLECVSTIEERDAVLAAIGSFPGDFDGMNGVDFDDFLKLSANFELEGSYSDGNADMLGIIDFDDFLLLSANFGLGGEAAAAAVPEPSTGILLGLGGLLLGLVRRRRS